MIAVCPFVTPVHLGICLPLPELLEGVQIDASIWCLLEAIVDRAFAFAAGVSGARRCATEPCSVPVWNGDIGLRAESSVDILLPGCRSSTAAMSARSVLEIGMSVKVSLSPYSVNEGAQFAWRPSSLPLLIKCALGSSPPKSEYLSA